VIKSLEVSWKKAITVGDIDSFHRNNLGNTRGNFNDLTTMLKLIKYKL